MYRRTFGARRPSASLSVASLSVTAAAASLLVSVSTMGCSDSASGGGRRAGNEASDGSEVRVAQVEGASATATDAASGAEAHAAKVPNKDEASRLATQLLAIKQVNWGKVTGVVESEAQWHVTFETPDRERLLIGQRTVVVDKATGVASIQKRR